jgi:hypothetical protein
MTLMVSASAGTSSIILSTSQEAAPTKIKIATTAAM